ncbi:MAG: rRNA pseudouridine synthase [Firmicutes bacterium]|nr:rRNA pseudouridine synthase [Bacillota bacterium]
MERLQKFMARAGVASRRRCEEMIASGMVRVNGRTVTEPGTKVDPSRDRVEVGGERLPAGAQKKVYLALYKPRGYVTTLHDDRGRKTVTDLIKNVQERIYPVGRLDYDSEGLLLLTNDGDFAYTMTHPKHQVPKKYKVRVKGMPSPASLERLASGMMLDDGPTAPAAVRLLGERDGNALLEITIFEGRNRQVRRMCEEIGHPVLRLVRERIGTVVLDGLRPGQYRPLSRRELADLKKMAEEKKTAPAGRKKEGF